MSVRAIFEHAAIFAAGASSPSLMRVRKTLPCGMVSPKSDKISISLPRALAFSSSGKTHHLESFNAVYEFIIFGCVG
jgi:hypothetical protein